MSSEESPDERESRSLLGSSAVMAAGTVVSKISGYVRGVLLVAALGAGLHADQFNIANTIPNMLYILLAGGVINAVLVPQLVRSMRHDPDGGEAYVNRVMTLAVVFLGLVTVLLVVAAPWLMGLVLNSRFDDPALSAQRDSAVAFARYCLPQVFFYGMFVLVGQVLNARRRFGPMMWAPIANNVIAVLVLVVYLLTYGPVPDGELDSAFGPGQEALLGLGSTLGIVVQLLVLVPYLRAAGVRFRPRFDFRGTGLGHTLRLGTWTLLFVVVNQVAYTVVTNLASSGTAAAALEGGESTGTGFTVYSQSFLITMVPHSIITVSLATAVLPLLSSYAAQGELTALGRQVSRTLRSALALVVPAAALLALTALALAQVLFDWGAGGESYAAFAPTMALFGLGVVLFTAHYLALRGYYAMEQTRRVFWIQCVIAAVNVGAALLLVRGASPAETAPRLVVAYVLAYGVGVALSWAVLARTVGDVALRHLVRFLVRLALAVGVAALVGWAARAGVLTLLPADPDDRTKAQALLELVLVGATFGLAYLGSARVLRLAEVEEVVSLVTRRLRPRR